MWLGAKVFCKTLMLFTITFYNYWWQLINESLRLRIKPECMYRNQPNQTFLISGHKKNGLHIPDSNDNGKVSSKKNETLLLIKFSKYDNKEYLWKLTLYHII